MSQTKAYSDLLALIEALAGADFQTDELVRIKALINRRARDSFRKCDYWQRFLKLDEERILAVDNVVPYEPSSGTAADIFLRIAVGGPLFPSRTGGPSRSSTGFRMAPRSWRPTCNGPDRRPLNPRPS